MLQKNYQKKLFLVTYSENTFGVLLCSVSFGTEYCAGFVDIHGQWNNGFYCPKWGDPDIQYCCGDEHERYCCTASQHPHLDRQQQQHYQHQQTSHHQNNDRSTSLPSQGAAQQTTGPIYYQYAAHLRSSQM